MSTSFRIATGHLLLGDDPRRRRIVRTTLLGMGVYALCVAVIGVAVILRHVDETSFWLIFTYDSGTFLLYLMVRLGWDQPFGGQGLPLWQITYALGALGLTYVEAPATRGAMCMAAPLLLTFAAFTMRPRECHIVGALALVVFAVANGIAAYRATDRQVAIGHYFELCFEAILLPTGAVLAAHTARLRRRAKVQKDELLRALDKIGAIATIDELTGLANRRHLGELIGRAIADGARSGAPLCLCLIDLDHFKRINDTHGHAAGDAVLRRVAIGASRLVRPADILGRWGGEEFVLALPGTALPDAAGIVERMRRGLADPMLWDHDGHLRVTFSAGVAQYHPGDTVEALLERADRALYEAKTNGRDRTVLERASDTAGPAPKKMSEVRE